MTKRKPTKTSRTQKHSSDKISNQWRAHRLGEHRADLRQALRDDGVFFSFFLFDSFTPSFPFPLSQLFLLSPSPPLYLDPHPIPNHHHHRHGKRTQLDDFKRLKEDFPERILIASIMEEHSEEGWLELVERVEGAGVDAIEINFSCPHGMPGEIMRGEREREREGGGGGVPPSSSGEGEEQKKEREGREKRSSGGGGVIKKEKKFSLTFPPSSSCFFLFTTTNKQSNKQSNNQTNNRSIKQTINQ